MVIDSQKNIPLKTIGKIKKACIVAQSTQNIEKVLGIVYRLKKHIPDLKFFNTICKPTRLKQEEIKTLPLKNGVIIIIGSKNSANTKRLYQISKSLNKRSYWVSRKKEIRKGWFRGINSVGVTAGASTPESTTQEIIRYIKKIKVEPRLSLKAEVPSPKQNHIPQLRIPGPLGLGFCGGD